MNKFSIIFLIASAVFAVGCAKDVETEKKPVEYPWVYDETLPVPIQFGAAGLDVKVKSMINSMIDLDGERIGVFALDVQNGWADENGEKIEEAICLNNESVTCAYSLNNDRYMLQFDNTRYYPYQSNRNFTFYAYYKGENQNEPIYESDAVKVPINGDLWGNQDVMWSRDDAEPLYVKYSEEINSETGEEWGYVPAEQDVDATACYNGFNASYVRYIAKDKPEGTLDHSYATHLPTMDFEHKTTCIRFVAVLDEQTATSLDVVPVIESLGIKGEEIYSGADFVVAHSDASLEGTFDVSRYENATVMLRNEDGSTLLNITPDSSGVPLEDGFFFQPISKNSPLTLVMTLNNGTVSEVVEIPISTHVEFKAGFYYTFELRIYKDVATEIAVGSVSPWLDGWGDAGVTPDSVLGEENAEELSE